MSLRKHPIEIENGNRRESPGEPGQRPQNAVIDQKRKPFLQIWGRLKAVTQHQRHTQTCHEVGPECDSRRASKVVQGRSTTSLKLRFSHSNRSWFSVCHDW